MNLRLTFLIYHNLPYRSVDNDKKKYLTIIIFTIKNALSVCHHYVKLFKIRYLIFIMYNQALCNMS